MIKISTSTQSKKTTQLKNRFKKLISFRKLRDLSIQLKKQKKKIVFTTGSYDLLNPGHCRYLAEAKSFGDILVVGVSTDDSDKRLRGSLYPLVNSNIRTELVSFLKPVDYVTNVDEDHPHGVLAVLRPDIFFTSETAWDEGMRDSQELFVIQTYGGKLVKRKKHIPYVASRDLVEHVANIRVFQILEKYLKDKPFNIQIDPQKHLKPADYADQKPKFENAFNSNDLFIDYGRLEELGNNLRKKGKKIVFVSGSYDLLHVGHARFIEQAGVLGDILIVGIPSDISLRKLKGLGRPIITERSRAYILGHLDPVDYVTIFDDSSVLGVLEKLKPDVFFTVAEEWNNGYKKSREYKLVKSYGGKVVAMARQAPYLSSSTIIDRMAMIKVKEIFKECMDEEKYLNVLKEGSKL